MIELLSDWIRRRFRGLFAWNTRLLVGMTLWRAGRFRVAGEWQKATEEMTSVVGLEAADYQNPVASLAKIRRRLAGVDPETAMVFFLQLTTFLVDDRKQAWVAAVHELDAGLAPGYYADVASVAARLQERTRDFSPVLRFLYDIRLGNVLGLTERSRDVLAVVEAQLGLRPMDYQDAARLRHVLRPRPDLPPEMMAMAIQMLASALGYLERRTECVAVLEAALGLTELDYADPTAVRSKVLAAAGPREAEMGANLGYLTLLSKALQDLGRHADSIVLYEADLHLESADYLDIPKLAAKMQARRGSLTPEMRAFSMVLFLAALHGAERYRDGQAVLEADLGIVLAQSSTEDLLAGLGSRCNVLPANVVGFYLASVSFILARVGRSAEAIAVLEIDSDLAAVDWRDTQALAERVNERLGELAPSTRLLYVSSLISALQLADEEEKAAYLADAYLRYVSPIAAEPQDSGFMAIYCSLYEEWLGWWGRDAEREPLKACRSLVPLLRQVLADQGLQLADRARFIREASDLRRRIIEVGLFWVDRETDSAAMTELRREVFLWDLEFAQRLLLERYRLSAFHLWPVGRPMEKDQWPLPMEERPAAESYLPDHAELASLDGPLQAIPTSRVRVGEPEAAQIDTPVVRGFDDLAHQGLDEAGVARSLGFGGLLLRVTFDPDGRLVWGALRAEQSRLDLVGFGIGAPGDRLRLRWAAARHDFAIGLLYWSEMVLQRKLAVLWSAAKKALPRALHGLATKTKSGAQVEEVMEELASRLPKGEAAARLLRLLRLLTWPLAGESDPLANQALRSVEHFVGETFSRPPSRSALDSATADYLRGVVEIWKTDHLVSILTPDTNLVVQGDDALHAVPVAWLPTGSAPLYRRVRSVRTSLAPQLDARFEETDNDSAVVPDCRRLLSVSYFAAGDAARKGACWLHHGHQRLAERFGGGSFAGADRETGNVGSIRATLEKHRRFAAVSICGHGDHEKAGIWLGGVAGDPILWHGHGCDLSGIDWLLLVSCSIGRASRTGDLDVEGFCIELAVHRARAILACRWPVSAVEAAAFANEAVRQFLELEGRPQRRALALAAARRVVCEGEKPLVSLNTAAAFELYGLG